MLGNGIKYVAQSWSGSREDSVKLRMIKASEYNRVLDEEKDWAKSIGFKGDNYWRNFVPSDFVFDDIKGLRKHYDALNKNWSPSTDTYANLENKNFALVDLSKDKQKFADGQAFFGLGILPQGSAQIRMDIAGKGTAHEFGYNTIGEWAVATKQIKEGERFY